MPRQARLDYPGCLHHLINRGIERRKIFVDSQDYETFLDTLGAVILKGKHHCYGWALMPNHFHLLVKTGEESISRTMSRLLTRYAVTFNKRHRRSGVLFQNRFKSIVCDEESYFKELVAYIHLNPLRAGLVKDMGELAKYPWSGHGALLGMGKSNWLAAEETLAHFGRGIKGARREYLKFLELHQEMRPGSLSGGGLIRTRGGLLEVLKTKNDRELFDTRILGEGDFVESALRQGNRGDLVEKTIELTLEEAMERVARETGVTREMVQRAGKSTSQGKVGRAVLTYFAHGPMKKSLTELGAYFGISQPATSELYQWGETWATKNPQSYARLLAK